jgi:hypothetical protein
MKETLKIILSTISFKQHRHQVRIREAKNKKNENFKTNRNFKINRENKHEKEMLERKR